MAAAKSDRETERFSGSAMSGVDMVGGYGSGSRTSCEVTQVKAGDHEDIRRGRGHS